MAKYDITHSCGHGEAVALFGPNRDRTWKIEHLEGQLCSDCWAVDRDRRRLEESQAAASEARSCGLPALEGSEKQVAWAEVIRKQRLDEIAAMPRDSQARTEDHTTADRAIANLQAQTSARWWIDTRSLWWAELVREALKLGAPAPVPSEAAKVAEHEAAAEATMRPPVPVTETVAEIRLAGSVLEVRFAEKRDDFWKVIKPRLHFEWRDGAWRRAIGPTTGSIEDRAVETAVRLLAAGFVVRLHDEHLRQRVISGEVVAECRRWVMRKVGGEYEGWLSIGWSREEDFYTAARAIRGSRYAKPSVVVPAEHFEEVLDFAERYEFQLSAGAQARVDEARVIRDRSLVATVGNDAPRSSQPQPPDTPTRLAVPNAVEIAPALRDE